MATEAELWQEFDGELFDEKIRDPLGLIQSRRPAEMQRIEDEVRQAGNAAALGPKLVAFELAVTRETAAAYDSVAREVWAIQGGSETAAFVRMVFQYLITPMLENRRDSVQDEFRDRAQDTGRWGRVGELGDLLGSFVRNINRIRLELEEKYENEAKTQSRRAAFKLPADLMSSPDALDGSDQHSAWQKILLEAEDDYYRWNVEVLGHLPMGPDGFAEWMCGSCVRKFDIWAERCIQFMVGEPAVRAYDRWLSYYAKGWFRSVGKSGHFSNSGLDDLHANLMERMEWWKAVARRHLKEPSAASVAASDAGERPAARGGDTGLVPDAREREAPSTAKPPQPAEGGWGNIEIRFLSEQKVQIFKSDKSEPPQNYAEMGFEDTRNGNPIKAWGTLRALAVSGGVLGTSTEERTRSQLEKDVQKIRRILRTHFSIASDPLPFEETYEYRARFRISCGESFNS
jgi:hypothetical protein